MTIDGVRLHGVPGAGRTTAARDTLGGVLRRGGSNTRGDVPQMGDASQATGDAHPTRVSAVPALSGPPRRLRGPTRVRAAKEQETL